MTAPLPMTTPAAHAVSAFPARALRVQTGANAGDPLPAPADSVCGDYYRLDENAAPLTLMLDLDAPDGAGRLAPGSDLGHAGDPVRLEGRLSLMAPDGDLVEVLVLDLGTTRVALPLSPLLARHVYTLIAADLSPGPIRLAAVVAGAFARGTRVALADGRQCAVEDLVPGDAVITRDHGAQVLRWKGAVTLRAEGGFAPVVVQPGVMGNPGPLAVSPHHRLFLYRRDARDLAGASGLLVQARHLVDDSAILRREGGHVEYFSLVFDAHEVIYAEGVPCESLMVCPSVVTRLPEDLAAPLRAAFPGLSQRLHSGADLAPEMVSRLPDRPGARPPLGS
ncbi:MAG: Hint domain-containing protein [Rhodobacter sp.]|nr:Hint domain-containing protein [Paracoccaceae bacterium]MCB1409095.1 Hint domain-containing protein [Paracoccaceae bacterium]MCC0079897.1 Hint domain-containing protein [Rhodobacter sp.]